MCKPDISSSVVYYVNAKTRHEFDDKQEAIDMFWCEVFAGESNIVSMQSSDYCGFLAFWEKDMGLPPDWLMRKELERE